MVVIRVGDFVCEHENTCQMRQCDFPYGCDLASSCPEYLASKSNVFVCEVCNERKDFVVDHTLPDFRLCYKDALEVTRHLIEDITRVMFNTERLDEKQFDEVVKLIKSKSHFQKGNANTNE